MQELCFRLVPTDSTLEESDALMDSFISLALKNGFSMGGGVFTACFCIEKGELPEDIQQRFLNHVKTAHKGIFDLLQFLKFNPVLDDFELIEEIGLH